MFIFSDTDTKDAGRSAVPCPRRLIRNYATAADRLSENRAGPRSIPGHPDQESSILDTTGHAPTAVTRQIEEGLESLSETAKSLEASLNAHITSRVLSMHGEDPSSPPEKNSNDVVPSSFQSAASTIPSTPYPDLPAFWDNYKNKQKAKEVGSMQTELYNPLDLLRRPPRAADLTLAMLLANQTHLGHHTSLWHPSNSRYIFGIRHGIHIISLDTTFAHLRRASKVVHEVARRGGIILFVGTRGTISPTFSEIVIAAAERAKGYHIFNRWTPGTLTNGQQILNGHEAKVIDMHDATIGPATDHYRSMARSGSTGFNQPAVGVLRPDLVVVLNCLENHVCLHECSLQNIPTIGIVDTDVNPSWVTYPIPANDDSLRSVALIAGVLSMEARDGQNQRLALAKEHGVTTYDAKRVDKLLGRSWRETAGEGKRKRETGRPAEEEMVKVASGVLERRNEGPVAL